MNTKQFFASISLRADSVISGVLIIRKLSILLGRGRRWIGLLLTRRVPLAFSTSTVAFLHSLIGLNFRTVVGPCFNPSATATALAVVESAKESLDSELSYFCRCPWAQSFTHLIFFRSVILG